MSPLSFVGTATLNLRCPYHFGLISTAIALDTLHISVPGTICPAHQLQRHQLIERQVSVSESLKNVLVFFWTIL